MNLKLNYYINVFYNEGEKLELLITTKDYKEFIDVVFNESYDLGKLLIIYNNDTLYSHREFIERNSKLEESLQEEISEIDDLSRELTEEDLKEGIYEAYDKEGNSLGQIINGEFIPYEIETKQKMLTPKQIAMDLNKYVKGQPELVKTMSNLVSRQLLKINYIEEIKEQNIELPHVNNLIIGQSGTGKTYCLETIEKLYNIPVITVDCSTLSKTGYIGESFSDFGKRLYEKCNGDINKMETAIVHIDEICKIADKGGMYEKLDVTSSVQGELLKCLEGKDIVVKNELSGFELCTFNTKNILFVVSGAFDGIEKIVENRLKKDGKLETKSIGFGGNVKPKKLSESELRKQITKEDIIDYGIKPELCGRLEIVCNLNELTEDVIKEILLSENGVLSKYKNMFRLYGKTLKLSEEVINYIVNEVMKNKKLGARSISSVIENILNETIFNMPSEKKKNYVINKNVIGA